MTSLPILWLHGAPGVGKTTVAWEIFERLGQRGLATGYVDIDQLGMCSPEPAGDTGRHRLKARALGAVAAGFRDAGTRCLVVPGVTDPGRGIEPVANAELTTCLLRADPAELTRRITARGGATDLAEALKYAESVDRAPGPRVDTTGLSVSEVADQVLARTGWPDPPEPVLRPLRPFTEPGEILLLCGPAAVGKSTVGWHVYQQVRQTGRNAAFVDLEQISFRRPEPGHELRVANLAAVWRTFRDAGAECLIAVGPPGPYPAGITVCCLHAGRDVLLDRLTRRARGETPAPGLAGDAVLGQPPEVVRQLADEAAAVRCVGDVHVDTDHRPPDAIAAEILRNTLYLRAGSRALP